MATPSSFVSRPPYAFCKLDWELLSVINSCSCILLIIQWRHNREQKLNKPVVIFVKNSDYTLFHFILLSLHLPTNWFKSSKQAEDLCCSAAVTAAWEAWFIYPVTHGCVLFIRPLAHICCAGEIQREYHSFICLLVPQTAIFIPDLRSMYWNSEPHESPQPRNAESLLCCQTIVKLKDVQLKCSCKINTFIV